MCRKDILKPKTGDTEMTTENYQIDLTTCFYPERTYIISLPAEFCAAIGPRFDRGELKFKTTNGWTYECNRAELKAWLRDTEMLNAKTNVTRLQIISKATANIIQSLMTTMGIN